MSIDKENSLWLGFQFIISLVLALITLKLNLMNYGTHLFDLWLLLSSIWSIGSIVDLGFGIAVVKYIARSLNDNEKEKVDEIASTSFFLFILLGFFLFGAGNLIAGLVYYNNTRLITREFLPDAKIIFIFLGIHFYFMYLTSFFRAIFEGFNNYVISSKLNLLMNLSIFLSVLVCYLLDLKLIWLSLFYCTSAVIGFVVSFLVLKNKLPFIRIQLSSFRIKTLKGLLNFSLSVQLMSLLGALIDPVIKYVIGNYASSGSVSIYELARRFALAIAGLFITTFRNILPKVSVLNSPEDFSRFLTTQSVRLSRFGIIYSGFAFGLCGIGIIYLLDQFYGFKESITFFFILGLAESVNNTFFNIYAFIIGIGKAFFLIFVQCINLVFISAGMILGFYYFGNSFGMLAYFFSALLGNSLILLFVKRQTEFSIISYFREIRFLQLLVFTLLIGVYLIVINQNLIGVLQAGWIFSGISLIIFYNDFIEIYGILGRSLMKRAGFGSKS